MRTFLYCAAENAIVLLVLVSAQGAAASGKIVVANDDWTLSDGYGYPPNDPAVFATNVAHWFAAPGASFRAWSNNFGLTGTDLHNTMTGAGYTWTASTAGTFDLPTLKAYDAIFLGGYAPDPAPAAVLTAYVNQGGNVYVFGGAGLPGGGGAPAEAAYWNQFLNAFGLAFQPNYNTGNLDLPISSGHPIFANVDHLYQNGGSGIRDLDPSSSDNEVLVTHDGIGQYAVYVPEPGSLSLLLLGGLGLLRRR
jgi:hypothetical protein